MAKMKVLLKSIRYNISQLFVYKEHEMEIGYPTDVRHIAHIGWGSESANAPSWLSEMKVADHLSSSFDPFSGLFKQSCETLLASKEFEKSSRQQEQTLVSESRHEEAENATKKSKRKKILTTKSSSTIRSSNPIASLSSSYSSSMLMMNVLKDVDFELQVN